MPKFDTPAESSDWEAKREPVAPARGNEKLKSQAMTTKLFAAGVVAACAFEIVAITTGFVPTISSLAYAYPLFGAVILVGLAYHFWRHR